MIITCPNCETQFNVDAAAFIPNGRTVRCAKCSHKWTQRPPDEASEPAAEPPDIAAAVAAAVDEEEPEAAPPAPPVEDDFDDDEEIPEIVERPVVPEAEPPRRRGRAAAIGGWAALVLVIVAVLGGAFLARERIVDLWAPAGQLYSLIGFPVANPWDDLEIGAPALKQMRESDSTVLVVSGEIANTSAEVREVPRLRVSLLNVRGNEITDWSFTATATELAPGDATSFTTRYRDPPPNARRVEVTFADPE